MTRLRALKSRRGAIVRWEGVGCRGIIGKIIKPSNPLVTVEWEDGRIGIFHVDEMGPIEEVRDR